MRERAQAFEKRNGYTWPILSSQNKLTESSTKTRSISTSSYIKAQRSSTAHIALYVVKDDMIGCIVLKLDISIENYNQFLL